MKTGLYRRMGYHHCSHSESGICSATACDGGARCELRPAEPSPAQPNERYEALADAFYHATGLMAPGKDDPTGHHSYDERVSRWQAWLAARAQEGA
jgi:hypothetical protein